MIAKIELILMADAVMTHATFPIALHFWPATSDLSPWEVMPE